MMFGEPPVLWLINTIFDIYSTVVIAAVILSLLISFNIVNRYQPLVQQIGVFLNRATEPLFSRIRKILPPMGGMDISPLIVLIVLQFVQRCINHYWYLLP